METISKVAVVAIVGNPYSGAAKGVYDKVRAQVNALNLIGVNACGFFGLTGAKIPEKCASSFMFVQIPNDRVKIIRQFSFFYRVCAQLVEFSPDIVYVRYPLSGPSLLFFLWYINKRMPNAKIIFERQAIEPRELVLRKNLSQSVKYFTEIIFRKPVQRFIFFNIGVTHEICNYIQSYYPKAKCIASGNGIEISHDLKYNTEFIKNNNEIRLVFVGNISIWNGLEYVFDLLKSIDFKYKNKDILFDVIGEGVHLKFLKDNYQKDFGKIRFLGFSEGNQLRDYVSHADLAIGALRNNERGLCEGSNLKLRLYCSLGIPFVLGEYDSDFEANSKAKGFYLKVDLNNPLDEKFLYSILDFAIKKKEEHSLKERMVEFATTYLTWTAKMSSLIDKLNMANKENNDSSTESMGIRR